MELTSFSTERISTAVTRVTRLLEVPSSNPDRGLAFLTEGLRGFSRRRPEQ
jgi:hypothetical protein